ncbi:MAG: outer membrane beta-barrel protein [Opitutaceae bacterium]|nr:outer membrane beta-barrel protein [Opitutaceae bacterium]
MSCKSILGIAALTCGPVLVFGAAGFILSDETTVHLTGVAQVRFDDNVNFEEKNKNSDTVFSLIPGIELDYNGGQTKGLLKVSEDFERYVDNSELHADLFSGVGELNFDSGKTKIDSRIGYHQMDQGSMTIRNVDQRVRHDLFDASVNGMWSASAKTSIGAGIMYDSTNYVGIRYADNRHVSLPVDVYYGVSPKVDVSVGYRYRTTTVNEISTDPRDYDSTDHFFNVGARGEFTPKLKGQVRVGYGMRDFDHKDPLNPTADRSTDQLSLSGALTYVYSPKTSFDFAVSNDFDNSALGISQEVFAVRTGGKFEFTPQWSANAGLSYQNTKYAQSNREDDFFVGDAGVVYAMSESVSFQASYIYRNNHSPEVPFNNNILSFGISLRY